MATPSKADQAVEARQVSGKEVPVNFLFFPKINDKNWGDLWHPRGNVDQPETVKPDQLIVDDIIEKNGVEKPIIVWQRVASGGEIYVDGKVAKKGDQLLIVGDGSQRTIAAVAAQPRMLKLGLLGEKKLLYVPIIKFVPKTAETAEREFLMLRQAHDADRLKKPHKPSVIAWNLRMCKKKGASNEELLALCPSTHGGQSGWTKNVMEAALSWTELAPEAAKAFDDGLTVDGYLRHVPIGLLPVLILHFPQPEHVEKLRELIRTGINSMKGFTRRTNAERPVEDGEPDGEGEGENEPDDKGSSEKPERKPRQASGRRPKARVERALDLLAKDPAGNILHGAGHGKALGMPELGEGEEARFFAVGMMHAIGMVPPPKMPAEVLWVIRGMAWVGGEDMKVPVYIKDAYERADEKIATTGKTKGKRGPKPKDLSKIERVVL